jgi:high affinity sulfate transporter 1
VTWSLGLADLRRERRADLRGDLVGGLTVTAYSVPQVMAYSSLAGLPPQTGLWVVALTMVVYFVLGSSKLLSSGPESSTALLTAAIIAPLAAGDPQRYASLAALLALMCGVCALIAWLLKLGFLGDLLSRPVLIGYMAGVAVIMITSQIGKVTGLEVAGDTFIAEVRSLWASLQESRPSWPSVAMGLAVAILLIVLTPRLPRVPMPLIVVALAALVTAAFGLDEAGIPTVGAIDGRPPDIGLASIATEDVIALILPAMGVFIVAYTDNILTARMLAVRHRHHVNSNRELLALGASNIAAAAVSGFPVSSSASRAVIGEASGARTQVSSLVAAAGVLAVLIGLPGVLASFPVAALGGLVVYAATRLVDVPEFRRLWSFRRREFALAVAAAASVLVFDILYGVIAAIVLSILELLTRVARPHAAVLGQAPGLAGWHDVDDYSGAAQVPGLLVYRYDSPLFFANADDFRRRVESEVDSHEPKPQWLLLNMEANVEVDITGLDGLERIRRHCADEGIIVALVRVKHEVLSDLRRHGVLGRIGEDRVYPTLPTAVQAFLDWQRAEG